MQLIKLANLLTQEIGKNDKYKGKKIRNATT